MPSYMTRLLSALVLIPLLVGVIWWGGMPFMIFLLAMFLISLYEWNNISIKLSTSWIKRIALITAGTLYMAVPFSLLSKLEMNGYKLMDDGKILILYLFLTIWASDTVAYIFGKNFGGPKMAPNISPNKTWAGYAGALLGPALTLSICLQFFTPASMDGLTPSWLSTLIVGTLIGITGQSGDLLESLAKRKAGVKDSGTLIPGHGGLLDRIDALLLVIPVYVAYLMLIYQGF
ncbi:MAG: phosphatidate cytidylyltransferase, partial [Alphaproteobacteria bacterium]|nr:phosphatidate cytidylyltransferase [Alphaproteobacteria bacterium]